MKVKARDGLDLEQLEDMVNSAGWQMLKTRVEDMLAEQLTVLQTDLDPEKTAQCRGFLRGANRVMQIPQILRNEVLEKQKQKETRR